MGKMYLGEEFSIEHNDDETLTVYHTFTKKTFAINDISAIHLRERKALFNIVTILNPALIIQTNGNGTHYIAYSKQYDEDFRNLYTYLANRLKAE